jgi:hypothetical protein
MPQQEPDMMLSNSKRKVKLGSLKDGVQLTNDSGRLLLAQLCKQLQLPEHIDKAMQVYKQKGYKPSGLLMDMMWLQLKGGDYVWDLREGYSAGISTYYRLLELFVKNPEALAVLEGLQDRVVKQYYHNHPPEAVTLDQDATLIASDKEAAAYCYQGYKSYHPMQIYDGELCVAHEFRAGNASPANVMGVLQKAYCRLPQGIAVSYRGDSASYNRQLIQFCDAKGITYAIGGRMCKEIKTLIKQQSCWSELEPGIEYAEIPHATTWSQDHHRFIITRRRHSDERQSAYVQRDLDLESNMMTLEDHHYTCKLIVTNRQDDLDAIVRWSHKRCGYGEQMHDELKSDLAGSHLPSQHFEANEAWWHITVLAYNLQQFINRLAFKKRYRMKQIRHRLLVIPCRLVKHARSLILQLPPVIYEWYKKILVGISGLSPG